MERDYREEARLSAQRRHEDKTLNPPSHARPARRRRSRRVLGVWPRVSLLVMTICAMGFMAFHLVVKIIHPYREAGAQTRSLSDDRARLAALDTEDNSLRQKIAFLKTPAGMTREARKMGYVHPGEIPFVVEGQMSSALPAVADNAKAAAPAPQNRAARLWHRLTGH